MIEGLQPLYLQIAESIQGSIEDEWSEAKIDAIFYDGSITYFGEYKRVVDGKSRGFATQSSGERAFRQIRKLFKEAGKPLWGQATFLLYPDGRFNMKWGYDSCDSNGNTIFDEDAVLKLHEERQKRLTAE